LSGFDVGSNETPFRGLGRGGAREEEEDVDGGGEGRIWGVEERIGNEMKGWFG